MLLDVLQAGQDRLLTVEEVAKRLRVDQSTIRRWIKQDLLAAIILPKKCLPAQARQCYRIRQSVVHAILSNHHARFTTRQEVH